MFTKNETAVVRELLRHREGDVERASGTWATVYLPNCSPCGLSARGFAGVLGSLKTKGVYLPAGGEGFFGEVLASAGG